MLQPLGFQTLIFHNYVCLLLWSLYGLKQSARTGTRHLMLSWSILISSLVQSTLAFIKTPALFIPYWGFRLMMVYFVLWSQPILLRLWHILRLPSRSCTATLIVLWISNFTKVHKLQHLYSSNPVYYWHFSLLWHARFSWTYPGTKITSHRVSNVTHPLHSAWSSICR